jgi:putative endonuclease
VNTRARGEHGETIAARYLRDAGYTIIQQNFRTRRGEVDIVCEKNRSIVFVEVKSWARFPEDELASVIGPRKRRRIIEAAREFLGRHHHFDGYLVRFDVVLIRPGSGVVRYVEGAFENECRA